MLKFSQADLERSGATLLEDLRLDGSGVAHNIAIVSAFRPDMTAEESESAHRWLNKASNDLAQKHGWIRHAEIEGGLAEPSSIVEGAVVPLMRALLIVEPLSKRKSTIRKEIVQLGENFRQPNVLVQLSGEPTAMLIGTSRSRDAYPGFDESVDVGKFNPLQIGHWFARFEYPQFYFTAGHRVPGYVGWGYFVSRRSFFSRAYRLY